MTEPEPPAIVLGDREHRARTLDAAAARIASVEPVLEPRPTSGQLPGNRLGGTHRIGAADLVRYVWMTNG